MADVGIESDTGRSGALAVLRDQRGCGDLWHHEAGIQTRPWCQECWQPRQRRIDQHRNAAFRDGADLAQRKRDDVGCEGNRLAVKVAAGQRFRWIAADQRIVRYTVRFDLQRRGRMTKDTQRGARHLRLATQAIGILHAIIAGQVRRTDLAAGNQCEQGMSHVDLSAMTA